MPNSTETNRQREALKAVYNSAKWSKRVNLMGPDQIAAVYLRLKSEGKVN